MTDERCDAAGCGRRHGLDTYLSVFSSAWLCAFHRGKLEAGEGVECRDGDTAYLHDGELLLMPPKWQPTVPPPTPGEEQETTT